MMGWRVKAMVANGNALVATNHINAAFILCTTHARFNREATNIKMRGM